MSLRITILGCGSSGGVPRIDGDWGLCDPNEPKNRRTRCSILVEKWQESEKNCTTILVDSAPDLREQFIRTQTKSIDALLYSHDHADQTHGIDDLRAIAYGQKKRIPTYMDKETQKHMLARFEYCFEIPDGRIHPPILEICDIPENQPFYIEGKGSQLCVEAFQVNHGDTLALGFIFERKVAYTPDIWNFNDQKTLTALEDMDVWIVDALRYHPHPTHAHADRALSWLAQTRTQRGILTNLHIDMDYHRLNSELMGQYEAAYDGMVITCD